MRSCWGRIGFRPGSRESRSKPKLAHGLRGALGVTPLVKGPSMPEIGPVTPRQSPSGWLLSLRVGAARAAVFWERCWPEFAVALGVLGLFLAAALFDLPAMV